MRSIAAILIAVFCLAVAPDATAAEPTATHPVKVSMKGWVDGVPANSVRWGNREFSIWLKGTDDIPKNEILVLRLPCGPQLTIGTNLALALWNKDTNQPVAGSTSLLLEIEAVVQAGAAEWPGGVAKKYELIARGMNTINLTTVDMTLGARVSTKPAPSKLETPAGTICTSKLKAGSLSTHIENFLGGIVFAKGKMAAGKPIFTDAP
jgi:hypothetical protein